MKNNIKAYRTTATTTIKKLAQKRAPKVDIYDDSTLDVLDDMASKWALRVERLRQRRESRKLST